MSFSNNCSRLDKIPGPISGNAMNGICERACIEVKKVFDACIKQETQQNVNLKIECEIPGDYTPPFRFISAKSNAPAKITDMVITPSEDDKCLARVRCNVNVPITILFEDSKGIEGVALSYMVIPKDVIMRVPRASLIPYEVEVFASVMCPTGAFATDTDVVVSACTTVVIKIVMPVDLLVPSYGYCDIPPCQEYTEDTCDSVFELPLYPDECGVDSCQCRRS